MLDSFAYNIIAFFKSDWLVTLLNEYLLNIVKLVLKLLHSTCLRLYLINQSIVFVILFFNLFSRFLDTFFGGFYKLHHSFDFWNQNIFFFLLGLSVLIFAFYFSVFKLTDLGLQRLVTVVDFSSFFFSLL